MSFSYSIVSSPEVPIYDGRAYCPHCGAHCSWSWSNALAGFACWEGWADINGVKSRVWLYCSYCQRALFAILEMLRIELGAS